MLMWEWISVLAQLDHESCAGKMLGELVSPVAGARDLTDFVLAVAFVQCQRDESTADEWSAELTEGFGQVVAWNMLKYIEGHHAARASRPDRKRAEISGNDS